ncbi:MAG: gluconate 2-dehydrogenase subunit 3 family protein [Flavobacteriaceae bacterium]|nr:MAG: gluconate 2-dehydrogenase subunit 3 family protein [Flavobacteriaceae bacterium]
MNRREAVKSLGMGVGFLVATPSILSLLQSCESEPEFHPVFVSEGEGHALREMVGLILPSDKQIPGARALSIHSFIDAFWGKVLPEEEQSYVKLGFVLLAEEFKGMFNKELSQGTTKEYDQLLAKYLKTSKEQQKAYAKKIGDFMQTVQKDASVKPDRDAAIFTLLAGIRGAAIWGWTINEEIGEKVLWYDPIPGQYLGCVSPEEYGNGRIMSL